MGKVTYCSQSTCGLHDWIASHSGQAPSSDGATEGQARLREEQDQDLDFTGKWIILTGLNDGEPEWRRTEQSRTKRPRPLVVVGDEEDLTPDKRNGGPSEESVDSLECVVGLLPVGRVCEDQDRAKQDQDGVGEAKCGTGNLEGIISISCG